MPCLEISMPRADDATRERLARELTRAVATATGHPAEILGIRFMEYEPGEVALGGTLWRDPEKRPYLHILLYIGRLGRAAKQALVSEVSKTFAECVERADWLPVIHIAEHPYDNVGVEGALLSDAYEQCRERPFYYDLE